MLTLLVRQPERALARATAIRSMAMALSSVGGWSEVGYALSRVASTRTDA